MPPYPRVQVDMPEGVLMEETYVQWSWSSTDAALEDYVSADSSDWRITVLPAGLQLAASHTFQAALVDRATTAVVATLQRTVHVDSPPTCTDLEGGCLQVLIPGGVWTHAHLWPLL